MNTETRKVNYLKTYKFFQNSIDFRICSSKMLEQWKNVQSFQLNQLVNGKFYFSGHLREMLLLKYDLWSKFLYEMENYCIEHGDGCINIDDLDFCMDTAARTFDKFNAITKENPEQFETDFMNIYVQVNSPVERYISAEIDRLENTTIEIFFTELVDAVIKMLQHELIVLHELQHLRNNKSETPALIITEFNEHAFGITGECFCTSRVKIYQELFNLTEVCVKNYTVKPINPAVAENIEHLGIEVNYKLSSRFDSVKDGTCVNKDRRVSNQPVGYDRRKRQRRFFKRSNN